MLNDFYNGQGATKILLAHSDANVRTSLADQLRAAGHIVITNNDPVELNRIIGYVNSGLLKFDLCIWDQRLVSSELVKVTESQQLTSAFPFLILFIQCQQAGRELKQRLRPAAVVDSALRTGEQLAVIEKVLPATNSI